jgi:hypothetical protein
VGVGGFIILLALLYFLCFFGKSSSEMALVPPTALNNDPVRVSYSNIDLFPNAKPEAHLLAVTHTDPIPHPNPHPNRNPNPDPNPNTPISSQLNINEAPTSQKQASWSQSSPNQNWSQNPPLLPSNPNPNPNPPPSYEHPNNM